MNVTGCRRESRVPQQIPHEHRVSCQFRQNARCAMSEQMKPVSPLSDCDLCFFKRRIQNLLAQKARVVWSSIRSTEDEAIGSAPLARVSMLFQHQDEYPCKFQSPAAAQSLQTFNEPAIIELVGCLQRAFLSVEVGPPKPEQLARSVAC